MSSRIDVSNALASVLAEFAFVILPLLVIAAASAVRGMPFSEIVALPYWSLAAATLAGLGLVRFVSSASRGQRLNWSRFSLVIAIGFVFLLTPALMVLALQVSADRVVSGLLVGVQIIAFLVCSAMFIMLATMAHLWSFRSEEVEHYYRATWHDAAERTASTLSKLAREEGEIDDMAHSPERKGEK